MKRILILLSILGCWSCSNMTNPTGGIKDTKPPELKKSTPPARTVYFEEGGFELEFDEIIDLENISGQLVVSPPLKEKPSVKYSKKKVNVHFDQDDLIPNTTYTFNFGNAIKDHNEGNILKNFTYVFSTGSYIDSLTIRGAIKDAYTQESVENINVLLYRINEDSMPLTSLPNYFGISDENGSFSVQNIKNGVYKVFALEDFNQNYIYDLPSERIAFLDEPIQLDSSFSGLELKLFAEDNSTQFVTSRNIEDYGSLFYTFNKPMTNMEVILKNEVFEKEDALMYFSENNDSLRIWFPDYEGSFTMIIKDDSIYSDTTEITIEPVYSIEEMPDFKITPNFTGQLDLNKRLILKFDNPITKWNASYITLNEDSMTVETKPYFLDSLHLSLVIPYEWKEKSKYSLIIGLGAFVDFYEQTNDIYELKFGAQEESFYGILHINIDIGESQPPYIFQLLGPEKEVISERTGIISEKITYSYLRPGEYGFRLIQDLNNNEEWDTGKYSEKRQAEPVFYYPSTSTVRSNWEVDLEWIIH